VTLLCGEGEIRVEEIMLLEMALIFDKIFSDDGTELTAFDDPILMTL